MVPTSESLTMQPKMKMVVYINRQTGETGVQEIPQWSENTRKLAVECKIGCPTAAKALRLLLPWKIDP